MLIGSLFSGCGGLDMAVQAVIPDTTPAWHSDTHPGAATILAHHWPHTPNLGDITTIDWGNVLWENVGGAYSAQADSSLEPCPGCVGDRAGEPVLRALGRVLGDLASLGYDAVWHGLRAAEVGAPHERLRVFVLAWDALAADAGDCGQAARLAGGRSPEITAAPGNQLAVADPERFGRNTGWGAGPGEKAGGRSLAVEAQRMILLPTPSAADGAGGHLNRSGERSGELLLPGVARAMGLLPTPLASDGTKGERWAEYADAIHQWETLTRPAPDPTVLGRTGKPQLAPAFSEWMMGYPAGHVTAVPGVTRTQQLTVIGNAVCPPQGAEALRRLLILREQALGVAA